jgi:hypothetical protein
MIDKRNIKTTSISDIEKSEDLSIWVLNNSTPPGSVNLSVNDGAGETVTVTVPVTWIPVDVTTQATKRAIISSPQFRRLVTSRMLAIVDPSELESIQQDPDFKKESAKLYSMDNVEVINIPQEVKNQVAASEAKVSGFILNLVMRDDVDEDSCLSALRGQVHSLTEADLAHLVDNSRYPSVKSWASEQLSSDVA